MIIHGQTVTSTFQWLSFMGFNAFPRNSNGIITLCWLFFCGFWYREFSTSLIYLSPWISFIDLQWIPQKSQIPTSLCVVHKKEELHAPGKNTSSTGNRPYTVLHGISYSSSNLATCACVQSRLKFLSAKGSIVGAKADPQTTSIRSLKLDSMTFLPGSLWSWTWICLLLIDLDQYSRIKACTL